MEKDQLLGNCALFCMNGERTERKRCNFLRNWSASMPADWHTAGKSELSAKRYSSAWRLSRSGPEIHSGGVFGGDDDLKQARVPRPLPLVRDGVERLFASAVEAFMADPVGSASGAFSFEVFSVRLPRTLNARVGVPNVYDYPPLKLPGCSFVLMYGASLA